MMACTAGSGGHPAQRRIAFAWSPVKGRSEAGAGRIGVGQALQRCGSRAQHDQSTPRSSHRRRTGSAGAGLRPGFLRTIDARAAGGGHAKLGLQIVESRYTLAGSAMDIPVGDTATHADDHEAGGCWKSLSDTMPATR